MEDMPLSFSCSDCQRHFPSLPELTRHRELLHSSAKQGREEADGIPHPYRSHPGSLANHQRNHETGLFPCTTCGKDFSNPLALQSHMRTHAPESHRKHGPPHAKETTPHLQSETMSTDSCGQKLGSGEGWENQTKPVQETHEWESGADPRAASGTWENPPTERREGLEIQQDSNGSTGDWVPTTNSDEVPPLPTPANNLLSNLEQYLAESVVNFTEAQESTEPLPTEGERRYKCDQCGKTYKHAGSLTNHRQSHTLGIYPCAICFKEFSNLMALKNHSRLHAQYRPYHCPHCPRAFRLPRDLLEHQKSHEGIKQEQPWEDKEMPTTNGHTDERSWSQLSKTGVLNGSGELSSSGQLEDGGSEEYRPFCCGDCGRTYRHAGSLINHRKSHQTGIYPCSICSKQLFNAAALKNHIRAHHRPRQGAGEDGQSSVSSAALMSAENTPKEEEVPTSSLDHRPYKCNECGRAYRHRGSLVNHRHSHRTGEYQCSLCPRKYPNLMALRNHVRVHCKATRRSTDPGTEGSPSPVKKEQPDPVGIESAFHADEEHVCKRQEEATSNPPTADRTVPQVCSICGMLFEDLKSLEHHSMTHREGEKSRTDNTLSPTRTFACQDCGKSYRHSGSLINHRQTHQTGDFSCGACAKHFHTMAAMKSHLRRHSRQWNRRHQKQDSGAGEEAAKLPPVGTWTLKLENDEDPDSSQDPLGESPCETEDNLERDGDCLHAGSKGNKCMLRREEACFLGDKEATGTEEGLEKKEACILDDLDIPGDEECSETGFCGSLPGVDSDQKRDICQSDSSSHSADTDTVWKAETTHTCSDCGDSFPHAAGLSSHRSCHPPGIYQCSLCPKEFDSLPALRSHFQTHRPGEVASAQPFLCCLCGMIFPGRTGYRRHLHQAHGASSVTEDSEEEEEGTAETASTHSPPLQLSEAELLNQLQREVEALDGAGYGHICGCCGQTYDDLGSLERHHQSQSSSNRTEGVPNHLEGSGDALEMVADHGFEGTVSSVSEGGERKSEEGVGGTVAGSLCMQAGESFLESHPRPFQCNQCGKTYRHGGSLVNHRKIHQTGDFICPVCSRCYPNLAAYRNHLRNHPRCKGSEPQMGPISEAGGCSEPQNAAEAGQEQAVIGQLQEELKVEPLEELAGVKEEVWEETTVKEEELEQGLETGCQTEVTSERPFSCEVCGRTYKHAGSLINHRQSHQTGHFGCQACSKGFSNLMSLKNHRRIHADPRHFCCSECGKAFRLRKQLANHQRVHAERRRSKGTQKLTREDQPFRCGQCGRTYRHAGSLLNHQCNHETGRYSCPFCFKTYSNRTALKDHQRLHSDSKRRRQSGWPQRAAAIHCTLCGCDFSSQGSLEQHLREHEEAKLELASGQGDQHGTEGSKENLDGDWGLEARSDGIESVLQVDHETKRPGEHSQTPSRPACSEVTESIQVGKVGGGQGDRGQMNHNGAWVLQDQLTKPEGKLEDTVSRNPCHLSESQSNGPTLRYMDSWNGANSSSQFQPESHCQCGKNSCQSDGLLNPSINRKDCHSCLLCSKEFLNPEATKIHNHTAAQNFACSNCSKVFESHSELATHVKKTHAVEHSQVTSQTEETRGPQAGMVEVDLPGPGKAQEVPSGLPRDPEENGEPADRRQGVCFTAEDKDRPFCCAQCGRSYRHAGSLLNHQKAHTIGLYPCALCPKLLPNLLSLKNHSRTHTDPKRYSCNICGKAFRTAARLQGHGRVHAPQEGPFTCSHCPRHFRHRISFLRHQQQHQEEWTVSSSGASVAPAASREDSSSASLQNPSPQWPADLNLSL